MGTEQKKTHLDIAELSERWGISRTSVRRLIWSGQLKSTRFGRSVRVSVKEADLYAETQSNCVSGACSNV